MQTFPRTHKKSWEKGVGLLGQNLQSPVTPVPGQMTKMSNVAQKGLWGTGHTPPFQRGNRYSDHFFNITVYNTSSL